VLDDANLSLAYVSQQALNALPQAALYAALAAAYALPFGLHRRADFSFGALHAFSGQMLVLAAHVGWVVLWLTLPSTLAFATMAALLLTLVAAIWIARRVIAPLARATPNTMLAATLGVMVVLMEVARLASDTRSFWLPPVLNTPIALAAPGGTPVTLTLIQLVNTGLMTALALTVHLAMRSRFGRNWRAVRDDPAAAALCGIDPTRMLMRAHLAGVAVASLAGVLHTAWLGTMDFGASLTYGLKIVFIAAIGGAVSPGAAALGGAALAFAETLWAAFAPLVWRDLFIFALLVLVLMLRGRDHEGV
jgi:branched-chain amino acid transport system permease protein